jgi:hypothetical protein
MKTITIHVPEETYRAYQQYAAKSGKSASELIRAAMDQYYTKHLSSSGSVFDSHPAHVGTISRTVEAGDDLLEEMLE